jgi:hypothetical protein
LLKKSPVVVSRGSIHINTSLKVDEVGRLCTSFKDDVYNSNSLIKSYCNLLKDSVDIKTESVVEMVKNYQGELIKQIDLYENKCIKNAQNVEEFKVLIKECEKNHKNMFEFLSKAHLEDGEIESVRNEAIDIRNVLTKRKKKFEATLFDKKKLLFFENMPKINPAMIGVISQTEFKSNRLECLINGNRKSINFNKENNTYINCFAWETDLNKFCIIEMTNEDNGTTNYTSILKVKNKENKNKNKNHK